MSEDKFGKPADYLTDASFVSGLYYNLGQRVIITSAEKLYRPLSEWKLGLEKKHGWSAPVALFIALLLSNVTSVPKDRFGISKDMWGALFLILAIGAAAWMLYSLAQLLLRKVPSIDEVIEQIGSPPSPLSRLSSPETPLVSDIVAGFSIDSNPVGVWSYGYSHTLGGTLILHTTRQIDVFLGVDRWASPQIEPNIGVMHNRTAATITGSPPTYTIPPDMLDMHPGQGGIYSVVRWTCPRSGRYRIQGLFVGLDVNTSVADTDVHVLVNSKTDLFPSAPVLRGVGTRAPMDFDNIRLKTDDTLDFIVGVGPSRNHGADSTGLQAKITQTGS